MLLRAREVIFLGTCRSRQEVYRTTQELLPPLSQAYPALASLMAPVGDGIYCHHPHEAKVIATMTDVRNKGITAGTASAMIRASLIPEHLQNLTFREFDPSPRSGTSYPDLAP